MSVTLGGIPTVPYLITIAEQYLFDVEDDPDEDDGEDEIDEEEGGRFIPLRTAPPQALLPPPPPSDVQLLPPVPDPTQPAAPPPPPTPPEPTLVPRPVEPPPPDAPPPVDPPEDPPPITSAEPTDLPPGPLDTDGGDTGLDDSDAVAELEEPPEVEHIRRHPGRTAHPKKKKPKKNQPPCDGPNPAIVDLGDNHWTVDRSLLEWYANHPFELDDLASVWTHDGADGEPDGFKLGLGRCAILKQAGFKSGDVVHSINDRRVNNIPQALAAYLFLRNKTEIEVHLTRRNGTDQVMYYTILEEEKVKRKDRKKAEEEAAAASTPIEP
jgi:hypothetical protein